MRSSLPVCQAKSTTSELADPDRVQRGRSPPHTAADRHVCQHSLPRTDLHLCLANEAVDGPTGLPLGLCSLALRYLLPECELERYLYCAVAEGERNVNPRSEDGEVRRLLTGSSSEGLSVPTFSRRVVTHLKSTRAACAAPLLLPSSSDSPIGQPEAAVATKADTDCMFEIGMLPVSPERGAGRLYMDARGASHSGYVRVLWDTDWSPPPGRQVTSEALSDLLLRPLPSSDGDQPPAAGAEATLCLSSDGLMQIWHNNSQLSGTVERHGPAVNSVQLLNGLPIDFDSVPALPLTQPPPPLRTWLKRLDDSHALWPPQDIRNSITTSGKGHLVATGHSASSRRDLEWRLSFSVAEKQLARVLTIAQRKVYILVKLLQKCFLAQPKVLVTYHLKTLLFWELEATQQCWSEEHLFGRVLGLLDRIDACLAEHYVPSYFLPDNNLISDCSASDVATVRRTLGLVRRDPIRSLFAIDSTVRLEFSTTSPLLMFHAPLMEIITAGTPSSSSAATEAAMATAAGLVRQARDGLARDERTLARTSELLQDAFQLRQPAGAAIPHLDDWLLMTTAALCGANHRDEDVWVRDVLRTQMLSDDDALPLTELHVRLWEAVCPSGVPPGEESPFLVLIRSCLDHYGDEVDRRAIEELFAEFIASGRPKLPGEGLMTLLRAVEVLENAGDNPQAAFDTKELGVEGVQMEKNVLTTFQKIGNIPPDQCLSETQRREAAAEICSALHHFVMDGFELSGPNKEVITRKLIEAGIPKSLAVRGQLQFGDDLFSLKLAGWDEFRSSTDDAGRYGDEVTWRFELIDSLEKGRQELFDPDISAEHVDVTNTALLETLGYLLLNGHYTLANHATTWLFVLVSKNGYITDTGNDATYNLRRASRFLACLPETVRSLLLLSSCEVSIPVVCFLLLEGLPLLEVTRTEGAETLDAGISPEERVVSLLAHWEETVWRPDPLQALPGAILLSDAVVKLCLVKLAGGTVQQCADCLTPIEQRLGGEATKHIRQALAELSEP